MDQFAFSENLRNEAALWGNNLTTEKGEIYTSEEVVSFILDLVGYREENELLTKRLLEPAFGAGDFLIVAVERLLESIKIKNKCIPNDIINNKLVNCIKGYELNSESYNICYNRLDALLSSNNITKSVRSEILSQWLVNSDFLLAEIEPTFSHVVGNPPYVRQELIPDILLTEYRRRFSTIYDRADLYIPFYEHSLKALCSSGQLGFICSDRWTKNKYGKKLRELISKSFHLNCYIDMYNYDAFNSDVDAYTAVTIISQGVRENSPTYVIHHSDVNAIKLKVLSDALLNDKENPSIITLNNVVNSDLPWLLQPQGVNGLLKRLEQEFPSLEEAGCKVNIGVATGNNKVFVVHPMNTCIEKDRLLPLVRAEDLSKGNISSQYCLINPFTDDGKELINLELFPSLKEHFFNHKQELLKRHVSQKNVNNWYRTIDKIYSERVRWPKLLIPDIKSKPVIVYDKGEYYPNNSIYYITSDDWDLLALRALLLSGIAYFFVVSYSTKIGGGCVRHQAQYLRKIRIPFWKDVPHRIKELLIEEGRKDNPNCASIVFQLYHFSEDEINIFNRLEG